MYRTNSRPLRFRQIHLDFHTSEHITGVGADFDAEDFVSTFNAAHVDSVTLFAKCHHGWSYYPTEIGAPHPHLERPDLLGDMVTALKSADIEAPIYISVQWDERNARLHPEWRAMRAVEDNFFIPDQLTAGWHSLCLNNKPYRDQLVAQAREVVRAYDPPGLFFDIILTTDCVCPACISRMHDNGLDPQNPVDRLVNDEAVNEIFRQEMSAALSAKFPDLRVFYNCGHIHKQGPARFAPYTHLEIESLPTGGWGYDHFPSSARYAAFLGLDYMSHTGKFHTSWGEFGGFKHPHALEYETAQMAALGAKCLVGDQLHPRGAINSDTYASIAPAYKRIAQLEPYLEGAVQVSEVAILSSEYFHPVGARNNASDDGAAQMLLELKIGFDVIDPSADFDLYRLIILPDNIPVDAALAARFEAYVAEGGKIIFSGSSAMTPDGSVALPAGIARSPETVRHNPTYMRAADHLDAELPGSAFVMYGEPQSVTSTGAKVLAEISLPYFNRTYAHFCSHLHAPDDPHAQSPGAAVTLKDGVAYIAYPIFSMYQAVGQPLYKYVVRGLIEKLIDKPVLKTDLPSAGRATLTSQSSHNRHVLHLLYGPPQVRGKSVANADGSMRVMEMIEDIPAIGPVKASVRLPMPPSRVYNANGDEIDWAESGDGNIEICLPRLHIHAAIVFEGPAS
jgi:hypothetical protein